MAFTENGNDSNHDDSSNEDTSNKGKDAATAAAANNSTEANDENADANDDLFSMAKMVPRRRAPPPVGRRWPLRNLGAQRPQGRPSTLTPPQGRSRAPLPRATRSRRGAATPSTPYAKNKIDIVLHECGMPSKDAQPQVFLLLGGKTLSVQWKTLEKLFSEMNK